MATTYESVILSDDDQDDSLPNLTPLSSDGSQNSQGSQLSQHNGCGQPTSNEPQPSMNANISPSKNEHYIESPEKNVVRTSNTCNVCGQKRSRNMAHICQQDEQDSTIKSRGRKKVLAVDHKGHYMCANCSYTNENYRNVYQHKRKYGHKIRKQSDRDNCDAALNHSGQSDNQNKQRRSARTGSNVDTNHEVVDLAADEDWDPYAEGADSDQYEPPSKKSKESSKEDLLPVDPNGPGPPKKLESGKWQCNSCKHQGATKWTTTIHQWKHTNFRPYQCAECHAQFRHRYQHKCKKAEAAASMGDKITAVASVAEELPPEAQIAIDGEDESGDENEPASEETNSTAAAVNDPRTSRSHRGRKPSYDPDNPEPIKIAGGLFKCNWCEFNTKWRASALKHQWRHTGKLPFKCHLCRRGFRQKVLLNNHLCDRSKKQKRKPLLPVKKIKKEPKLEKADAENGPSEKKLENSERPGPENMSSPPIVIAPPADFVPNTIPPIQPEAQIQQPVIGFVTQVNSVDTNIQSAFASLTGLHTERPANTGFMGSTQGAVLDRYGLSIDPLLMPTQENMGGIVIGTIKSDADSQFQHSLPSNLPVDTAEQVSGGLQELQDLPNFTQSSYVASTTPLATCVQVSKPTQPLPTKASIGIQTEPMPNESNNNGIPDSSSAGQNKLPQSKPSEDTDTAPKPTSTANLYKCILCKIYFEDEHMYTSHMRFHDKKKVGSCARCSSWFTTPLAFLTHLKCHGAASGNSPNGGMVNYPSQKTQHASFVRGGVRGGRGGVNSTRGTGRPPPQIIQSREQFINSSSTGVRQQVGPSTVAPPRLSPSASASAPRQANSIENRQQERSISKLPLNSIPLTKAKRGRPSLSMPGVTPIRSQPASQPSPQLNQHEERSEQYGIAHNQQTSPTFYNVPPSACSPRPPPPPMRQVARRGRTDGNPTQQQFQSKTQPGSQGPSPQNQRSQISSQRSQGGIGPQHQQPLPQVRPPGLPAASRGAGQFQPNSPRTIRSRAPNQMNTRPPYNPPPPPMQQPAGRGTPQQKLRPQSNNNSNIYQTANSQGPPSGGGQGARRGGSRGPPRGGGQGPPRGGGQGHPRPQHSPQIQSGDRGPSQQNMITHNTQFQQGGTDKWNTQQSRPLISPQRSSNGAGLSQLPSSFQTSLHSTSNMAQQQQRGQVSPQVSQQQRGQVSPQVSQPGANGATGPQLQPPMSSQNNQRTPQANQQDIRRSTEAPPSIVIVID